MRLLSLCRPSVLVRALKLRVPDAILVALEHELFDIAMAMQV